MKRKITDNLVAWKERTSGRKPLLLYGARQVGKTYIIRKFADEFYKNAVYVNFERMEYMQAVFNYSISPEKIIKELENAMSVKIIPEQTLIIFDEIQKCEKALTSLKYFAEEAPEYHIIAAGSLLGVAINTGKSSFPVGKVEMLTLLPFDFEEFLWAQEMRYLADRIKEAYAENIAFDEITHQETLRLYRQYLAVGGMPEAVKALAENQGMDGVLTIQENIINAYISDMTKYTGGSDSIKNIDTYHSIPAQLAKENKKFQYKLVRKGATANLFGEALQWLISAGVLLKCSKVTEGKLPLEAYKDLSAFKMYMSDVGLLAAKAGIAGNMIIANELSGEIKGAITENYAAQALIATGRKVYYWESGNQAEVDFVIQEKDGRIVPIEVKAEIHVKAKSLSVFMKRYGCDYAIRISAKNFGYKNGIKSVPLYAVFCI